MNLQNLTLQQLKVEYKRVQNEIDQHQKSFEDICHKMNEKTSTLRKNKLKISDEITKQELVLISNKSELELLDYFFNACNTTDDTCHDTKYMFDYWLSNKYKLYLVDTPFNTYTISIWYNINDLHFTFVNDQINSINKILPYIEPVPNDCEYFNNRLHGTKIIQLRVEQEDVFTYWISISPHDNSCTLISERTWGDKKLFTFNDNVKTLNDIIIDFINTFYV